MENVLLLLVIIGSLVIGIAIGVKIRNRRK